ncbi:hypothetical protein BX070DRAFT_233276 [Coemansia spiralis]|nr:hypothetical protein BX070DRAFT_233276 [Coemansia spiralis]
MPRTPKRPRPRRAPSTPYPVETPERVLASNAYRSIFWDETGTIVRITNTTDLEQEMLQNHFNTRVSKSFTRQLHLYNFTRITDGRKDKKLGKRCDFAHSLFTRDAPEDVISAIPRKNSKKGPNNSSASIPTPMTVESFRKLDSLAGTASNTSNHGASTPTARSPSTNITRSTRLAVSTSAVSNVSSVLNAAVKGVRDSQTSIEQQQQLSQAHTRDPKSIYKKLTDSLQDLVDIPLNAIDREMHSYCSFLKLQFLLPIATAVSAVFVWDIHLQEADQKPEMDLPICIDADGEKCWHCLLLSFLYIDHRVTYFSFPFSVATTL